MIAADYSTQELKTLMERAADEIHNGQFAPVMNQYNVWRPAGAPSSKSFLKAQGYLETAQGWAAMMGDLLGLPLHCDKPEDRLGSSNYKTLSVDEIRGLFLDVAERVHGGQFAPLRNQYDKRRPPGAPGGTTLLKAVGHDRTGDVAGKWAATVTELTGLPIYIPPPPKPPVQKGKHRGIHPLDQPLDYIRDRERNREPGLVACRAREVVTDGKAEIFYMLR